MEHDKYIYQTNIRIIKDFYNSKYCEDLKEKRLKKNIIDAIYIDPDYADKQLYKDLSEKLQLRYKDGKCVLYSDVEIKLSADSVCGWKQLYELREGNKIWLDDYNEMRRFT